MSLTLYAHPFSSYCWKALIALYENDTPFVYRSIDDPAAYAELGSLWPLRRFPVLTDGDATVIESSVIVEHLMHRHPGRVRLIPGDIDAALNVRFLDRFFDNYVMTPMQTIVIDRMVAENRRNPERVTKARGELDVAYGWLEARVAHREWGAGGDFTLADCSAAPSLFYADWAHPIGEQFPGARAYRARLLARPSVARIVEEARPYRKLFSLGAPDRD